MLFNSYEFLLAFLPLTFFGFFALARLSHAVAAAWLCLASLVFYSWWHPVHVLLLLGSITFNFLVGSAISTAHNTGQALHARRLLWFGVVADLALLGYFKYANFLVDSAAMALDGGWHIAQIALPLGISFFTFTQIAFLVDAFRGEVKERNPIHYGLFVTWFPHLIAGPVLHHKEMMPQFAAPATYRFSRENVAVGGTMFIMGLFKKVVLADGVAVFVAPVFAGADSGVPPGVIEAWCGALAYTLQLYFDFSGYSDMAIGLSRMFGVRLPLNFDSPYKAASIIDFWRRWHMTLSRFLRDYLYIALGGNRRGPLRRYMNLLATMVLGGLWHGAGWTFVAWGTLHGLYLCVNNGWRALRAHVTARPAGHAERLASTAVTFLAVVVAWVFFRAADFDAAWRMLDAMRGHGAVLVPTSWPGAWQLTALLQKLGVAAVQGPPPSAFDPAGHAPFWIAGLLAAVWCLPNTQQVMAAFRPALETARAGALAWRPSRAHAICAGCALAFALLHLNRVSEFLYFQF
ncbi:MAG: MBOAT family protein [Gammaproteobacteria bacterium]|nr:MBOAT family protein [Gammaproteobacteria bacterium]